MNIEIHVDEPKHLEAFVQLNEEWIEQYFHLEESDRALARNPESIIDGGGHIISITEKNEVIGVCGLFARGDNEYELARMAVHASARGRGIGRLLANKVIERARSKGTKRIFLVSNTVLEPAISLYRSLGFRTVREGAHPLYERANIEMELRLD